MKITETTPAPVPPPRTFTLEGITEARMRYLVQLVGNQSGDQDAAMGMDVMDASDLWDELRDALGDNA